MATTVIAFSDYQYPSLLAPVREAVLNTLGRTSAEGRKIASCKGSRFQCRSTFCPSCIRQKLYRQELTILDSLKQVAGTPLKFATLTAKDVPLAGLRDATSELLKAGRRIMKRIRSRGHLMRAEVSLPHYSDQFHPHLHAMVDYPSGGRHYVPMSAWQDEWLAELPAWLQPSHGGADVRPVTNRAGLAGYMTKSPFAYCAHAPQSHVDRIVSGIFETKGLARFDQNGSLSIGADVAIPFAA
jgi:hypothetical protein